MISVLGVLLLLLLKVHFTADTSVLKQGNKSRTFTLKQAKCFFFAIFVLVLLVKVQTLPPPLVRGDTPGLAEGNH